MKASDLYGSRFLSATDLVNGPVTVEIEAVEVEEFLKDGKRERPKLTLRLKGCKKGLVVNATNMGILTDQVHEDTDYWPGTLITLGVKPVLFAGRKVPGIVITEVMAPTPGGEIKNGHEEAKNGEVEKLPPRSGRGKAGTPAA